MEQDKPYDFDALQGRRAFESVKWNCGGGEIPLWIADMDFAVAPVIQDAIRARSEHPVYGYTFIPDSWAASYREWWARRHNLEIDEARLMFCTGVVPAISSAVRRLTHPAENVVLMTPVYNIFFNSIVNNGRSALEVPLSYDAETGEYSIDFALLEKRLSEPQTTAMILCNPHNPVGRCWTREELREIGRLCVRCGVTVISDEIHCDITSPGASYVPFASVDDTCAEISVTCFSPTKAFNIAGIHTAAVYAPSARLYNSIYRALNNDEIAEPDIFACRAVIAAFSAEGERWLDAARDYIKRNKDEAARFIRERIPGALVTPSDATYLLWIRIPGAARISSGEFCRALRRDAGVILSPGRQYGAAGEGFVRLNVACPRALLLEALERCARFCSAL